MKIHKLCVAVAVPFSALLALSCADTTMGGPGGDDSGDVAACKDGIDNDGDGLTDFPDDPGCALGLEDSEDDDCPDGPNCPACGNGRDDDGDGAIDFPDDSGCASASDSNELMDNPQACGGGVKLEPLDTTEITGTVEPSGDSGLKSNGCGGSGGEVAYSFAVTRPSSLIITTDFEETQFDTVVYIRSSCGSEGSELGCNDDAPDAIANGSTLFLERVEPGEYFIIVDGQFQGAGGQFRLQVNSYIGRDEECAVDVDECAPGLLCQNPLTGPTTTCVPPRCSDGIDNDGDGMTDYPVEPGCATLLSNDEVDDCPSGPNCPQCSNGIDDDGDGFTDMGADIGCGAAGDDVEEDCEGELDPIAEVVGGQVTGNTSMASNDFVPSCSSSSTAPEIVHVLRVPGRLLSLHADTNGSDFDSMLYIKAMECSAADMDCDDQSGDGSNAAIDISDVDPGTYYLIVDGWSSYSGEYTLNVSGVIGAGETCDAAAPEFACQAGYACVSGTCMPAACNDGTDNDGDGVADFPNDPGCDSPSDATEADDCPSGPNCPACSNGMDDDGDGVSDYGDDPGCASASDGDEEDCGISSDGLVTIDMPQLTGNTMAATNDTVPSCRTSSTAPDLVHRLVVPGELESLTVDTNGSSFDTTLHIRAMTCEAMDLACDDDGGDTTQSMISLADVAPGDYFIFVDGYLTNSGPYTLNVSGVIKAGESCDAALDGAGVFSCGGGTSCTGGMCQ